MHGGGLRDATMEAGAKKYLKLTAKHLAGAAQFTAEAIPFAQQARLAVSAAVLEFRKHERDQRKPIDKGRQLGDAAIVGPEHAQWRIAFDELVGIGEKARRRQQHRHAVRQWRVVEHAHVLVFDDLAGLNEWHKHAP